MTVVVDASVVVKWFLPEIDREAALRLRDSGERIIAPDHLFAESTNAVRKKVRRGEVSPEHARGVIGRIVAAAVGIEVVSCLDLASDAFGIAMTCGCSVYDAIYVALAVQREARLITAADRLYKAVSNLP